MRLDVMLMTATWRLQAIATMPGFSGPAGRAMSVPVESGRRALRIRTGMLCATAGRIVAGCSTFAPK